MSEDRPVYDLLPAVHRNRDAELGHPLRALLEPVEEELRRLREDNDGLYDNWFVETCAEWVLPYLGDLLGVEPVAASPDGATPRRAFIANTLRHRRRKGTPATLEQPAQDITGLPAKVVEYFQLLGTTQHVNHPRLGNVRTPDLRDTGRLQLLGTPFDQVARTADVRHVDRGRGRYNLGAVGLHLWRLSSHPQLLVQARRGRQLPLTAGLAGALEADPPDAEFLERAVVGRGAEATVGDDRGWRTAGQRGDALHRRHPLRCVGRVPTLELVVDDEDAGDFR